MTGQTKPTAKGRALTLIEVMFVMLVLALLMALLFPVFLSSRRQAFQATYMSQMRQFWVVISLYMDH
jgi:prepilin-type N-terminal cleavage/methylation domain-containing protein